MKALICSEFGSTKNLILEENIRLVMTVSQFQRVNLIYQTVLLLLLQEVEFYKRA